MPIGGSGTLYNALGSLQNLSAQEPNLTLAAQQSAPTVSYDGIRFVYGYLEGNGPGPLLPHAATVHMDATLALSWHEGHLPLSSQPSHWLHINHGANTRRGVHMAVFQQDSATATGDVGGAFIDARLPGSTSSVADTGCGSPNEPTISLTGTPAIGRTFTVTLGNLIGAPFLLVGAASVTPLPGCGSCQQGVMLPAAATIFGSATTLQVPNSTSFLHLPLAFQGMTLGQTGGCPTPVFGAEFAVSDTLTIEIL